MSFVIPAEYDTLSLEQKYAFHKFRQGQNLFITGPGGTGKSRLIQLLYDCMKINGYKFKICAMTGCAAILLGCEASTVHSWSGIRLGQEPVDRIIQRIHKNRRLTSAWCNISVLVLDEVSMLSRRIFEMLDDIGKAIRRNKLPFGGIQVIFTGDFFQLPPVGDNNEMDPLFCFESPRWRETVKPENHIELKTIFRQTDPKYIEILQQIRRGALTRDNVELLHTYVNREYDAESNNGCSLPKLFPVRTKVDYVNRTEFQKLGSLERVYEHIAQTQCQMYLDGSNQLLSAEELLKSADLSTDEIDSVVKQLLSQSQCQPVLTLKIGATVMCTSNLDIPRGICNGAQGKIIAFEESPPTKIDQLHHSVLPVVRFANGVIMQLPVQFRHSQEYPAIAVGQIPLCLAWALTIHKIQGATMKMAEIDIGSAIFEYGQTYVALSRIQSLEGLYLSSFYPSKIRTNPKVIAFYDAMYAMSPAAMQAFVETQEIKKPQPSADAVATIPTEKWVKMGAKLEHTESVFDKFAYVDVAPVVAGIKRVRL